MSTPPAATAPRQNPPLSLSIHPNPIRLPLLKPSTIEILFSVGTDSPTECLPGGLALGEEEGVFRMSAGETATKTRIKSEKRSMNLS